MGTSTDTNAGRELANEHLVDDRGTTQEQAKSILQRLRDQEFGSSNEELATALGRTAQQVETWMNGQETIDEDVMMKARGLARERGINLEA